MRLRQIGVVMQTPARNLLAYESAYGNVQFAQRPTRRTTKAKRARSRSLLEAVGLASVSNRRAGRLSGGEQQRLALAVAFANVPDCCWRTSQPASSTGSRRPRSSISSGPPMRTSARP